MSTSRLDPQRALRLLEVGRSLVSQLDLDALLVSVLEAARELTGARYAALGVLDERREALERFITLGIDEAERAAIGELPRGHGVLGLLIEDPRPLRLADVGEHPRSYGFPTSHPRMSSFLGVPVGARGEVWGNLYLTEKEGGLPFDEADEEAVLVLADWAAPAIANARLFSAAQVRRNELERVVRTLETTTEIARAVGGETNLDRILELIAKRARALVDARGMLILLLRGDQLEVTAMAGELDRDLVGVRLPLQGSVSGDVLRSGRAQRLADVRSRMRFTLADRIDAEGGLFVPLMFHGRALGVIEAFDRLVGGPEFTGEDERLMQAFAASAATAVATAQDVAATGLARSIDAAEHERSRWARELHDETLQELAALKISLAAARRSGNAEGVIEAVDGAIDGLDDSIRSLRGLITDLRPAALDTLGAGPALEALVDRVSARTDAEVTLEVDLAYESGRVAARHAPAVEAAIYRISQEALTNALKHAGASVVRVSIVENDERVDVTVVDDGAGFDPRAVATGFGLIGMRERVVLLGGTLSIDSAPGRGATVHASVPTAAREHPDDAEDLERRAG